jgi:hypothetical protein
MNKYGNGYLPKMEYWSYRLMDAVKAGDMNGIEEANGKLAYFIQRQKDVYGKSNVIAGVDFSESLNLLNSL